ncbi:hypothetical protein E4T56_gene2427 [Termitomyces sp. T112]|nr:hypothetical protein E4T56_gene2427 [Termitomyces sp. T112]
MMSDCKAEIAIATLSNGWWTYQRGQEAEAAWCSLGVASLHASPQESQACYSSIFKELALIIIGRDDIPVPPSASHLWTFLNLCNPNLEREEWEFAMETLITYIKTEDEKKPTLQTPTSNPKPTIKELVQTAWKTAYVGNAHELLKGAMNAMYSESFEKPYANFCAIIQGSGTGKSRLVDKVADSVFMIPMVLRPTGDRSGFPQGDMADGQPLLGFFCTKTTKETLELHLQRRYLLFLLKIIAFVDGWINLWKRSGLGIERVAADWKEYLGPPLSPERLKMYTTAIDPSPLRGFEDISDERVEFDHLRNRVKIFIDSVSKKIEPAQTDIQPVIVFYFDEAHHLSKTTVSAEPNRTAYQCLCKAFTYMMNAPVFALFLSTYSRLSETVPTSSRNFWSSRPMSSHSEGSDDNMNAPFVELPFDAWKEPSLVIEGTHSSQEICSLKFMARFGRPLFWTVLENTPSIDDEEVVKYAMSKLELRLEDTSRDKSCKFPLQKLIPPLSVRVNLSFELNRDEAVFLEGLLVASSMRTVYSVPKHQQYLRGGYPSEPFVAEAAARAIFKWCHVKGLGRTRSTLPPAEQIEMIIAAYKTNIPSAISQWLELGLIDQGTREELVVRMLCTLAHDIAILKNPDHEHVNAVLGGVSGDVSFSQMIRVEDFLRALISSKRHCLSVDTKSLPGLDSFAAASLPLGMVRSSALHPTLHEDASHSSPPWIPPHIGTSILLAKAPTGSFTCPVSALHTMFTVDPKPHDSPLFANPNGSPLTCNVTCCIKGCLEGFRDIAGDT